MEEEKKKKEDGWDDSQWEGVLFGRVEWGVGRSEDSSEEGDYISTFNLHER